MIKHYTPIDVARVLAKHLPRNVASLLEPAVGTGLLLAPILDRLSSGVRVVGVDVDAKALQTVKSSVTTTNKIRLELLRTDFLKWSAKRIISSGEDQFDCVLMNPPFLGKRADSVRLSLQKDFPDSDMGVRSLPVEAAFLVRGIGLLKPGGRLLGVFPASLISAISTAWLRGLVLQFGSVLYVHELPRFTFKDVEARVYLFVFEKESTKPSILLCNHDLATPEVLKVRRSELGNQRRLDFAFHKARRSQESLRASKPHLGWTQLKHVATILRGGISSPEGTEVALHTADYHMGFWQRLSSSKLRTDSSPRGIRKGDILVKRVGRDCVRSIGRAVGHVGCAASDCVLILRPNRVSESTRLLFALRVLLACDSGSALLEHGTGASYLTEFDLMELPIPLTLATKHPRSYKDYKRAVEKRGFGVMRKVEVKVRSALYSD